MLIRKPTLIILALAIVLGGAVYYFDWKRGNEAKPETFKRAYSLQASDVVSFTLSHPARPGDPEIRFSKTGGSWQIVSPVATGADQSVVDGIVDQIAGAEIMQTEPGTPDRLKAYGLDPAQASLELQLANGQKHTLLVGTKSFDGNSIYAIVDGAKNVSLLPELLSTSTARTLDTLRDRAILHLDSSKVASFSIKSASGEVAAAKDNDHWKLTKPIDTPASQDAVASLLQAVSGGTINSVAGETADNLAHYGLATPAISFAATDSSGGRFTLIVGKKDGDAYFARDISRPTIFRVNDDLYKKLTEKFTDLRDKQVVRTASADIQQLEFHNANGAISLSRKKDGSDEWVFDAPADQKGKLASSWKILDPLTGLTAEEVIDHPAADLLAPMSKPAVTVVLTDRSGKSVTVKLSKAVGDFVYAQASDSSPLFKLKKGALDGFNLKAADLAP
ncbi:MAG TPA: DUF4340 domain-containing protein [Candidatus Acidoferrales bacterium]|nr:DUF4340 domain-containing protein [Candidatus Acidoferrales bacterium]